MTFRMPHTLPVRLAPLSLLMVLLMTIASAVGAPGGVGAQEVTTTTEAPTTTSPTTSPDPGATGDSTTSTTALQGPPLTNPDGTPVVTDDDKGAGEEPPDQTPPSVDLTVPPRTGGGYEGQVAFRGDKVLISNVKEARKKLRNAEAAHAEAVAVVKVMRLRTKALDAERQALDAESEENLRLLLVAEQRMQTRALNAFVAGGSGDLSASLGSVIDADSALAHEAQQTLVETVFESDEAIIAEYEEIRHALDGESLSIFDRQRVIVEAMSSAVAAAVEKGIAVEQAKRELEAFEAGSQIYVSGVVFPIQWPYEVPIINSWGFPRMPGTVDAHWHEGIDLFAPAGTPLLATERGIVTKIGSGRLGGLRLWLRGESGTDWYYAHLSGFTPGLREGDVVEAGDVIGFVGNTGNAVGTPPHLHMQVHPNGGEPVNPYPLLKVVSDREILEREQADE